MKYFFVKQQDSTDCAAACMAMVCLYYKKEMTISKLRDKMGTTLKGTNVLGLSKCAKELGFNSQAIRVDKNGFMSEFSLPAIAHLITNEGFNHFVVVYKITEKYVVIGDPADKIRKVRMEEFYSEFSGVLIILKPNEGFEKTKEEKTSIFRRYLKLFIPQKKLFFLIIGASVISTFLGIILSLINNIIFDEILPYQQLNILKITIITFLIISIMRIIVNFCRQWTFIHFSIKIDIPLISEYFKHVFYLPMRFYSTRKIGDIVTRFSDAFTIKNIFTNIGFTLIMDTMMVVITGIVLFNMNSKLFFIDIIAVVVSIILVVIFKHPYKIINEKSMKLNSSLNSEIIEGLRNVETIKLNSYEESEIERIERYYIKVMRMRYKEGIFSGVHGMISNAISVIVNILLIYTGISQVIISEISLGDYMAFMSLSSYFTGPIVNLVNMQLSLQEANISMKRLSEILDYETEYEPHKNDINIAVDFKQDIHISELSFRYGSENLVLDNVSFIIPKGKKVALVGGNGSGKSTVAKLLLRYYESESGSVYVGNRTIKEFTNREIREKISYVPQNIELFSRTIFENIRIAKPNATMEEVIEASIKAGAHDFIVNLPHQYDTIIEEGGNGLSGGEKQRIMLARAFLKDNDLFILDECTSGIDYETENKIFSTLYNKYKDKSMLIITHRLPSIKYCDNIIVMDKGRIVEQGCHEDLINRKGVYYKMWKIQEGENFVESESVCQMKEIETNNEIITYS